MSESITSRPYRNFDDFQRVHDLLTATYPVTPLGWNWEFRRWEGWHFHHETDGWLPQWSEQVHLWETVDGQLAGVAHTEYNRGDAYLELYPEFRHLEADMIGWAEARLAVPIEGGQQQLDWYVLEYDEPRQRLLSDRGYTQIEHAGVVRRLHFGDRPLPDVKLAPGYTLRGLRRDDWDDCQRIADVLNAAFNRTIHHAAEFHRFATRAPSFRYELQLVAEAPDGSFAAHVGVNYEPASRYGVFEPVCTHPAHRQRGLAQALMFDGLHRLAALGAASVTVDTGTAIAANALYESIGFTEVCRGYLWRRVW